MGDIAMVAERLRLVRKARRKFLRMWEIEQKLIDPLVERLAEDLAVETTVPDQQPDPPVDEP